jgi:carbon monoxide dehydrogenase subunit G
MAVMTTDILLTGVRRDDIFEWLGDPKNHGRILEGAFDGVKETGPGQFDLTIKMSPLPRTLHYAFAGKDDSHGGRRILVTTSGKRVEGHLNYSLRTMKPSTNTLVTAHLDYEPGRVLGAILDATSLKKGLEDSFRKVLENLAREVAKG